MPTRIVTNWKTGEVLSRVSTPSPDDCPPEKIIAEVARVIVDHIIKNNIRIGVFVRHFTGIGKKRFARMP